MGTSPQGETPLECPQCGGKVGWNGREHVCISCSWTEFKHRPPFEKKIRSPKKKKPEEEE